MRYAHDISLGLNDYINGHYEADVFTYPSACADLCLSVDDVEKGLEFGEFDIPENDLPPAYPIDDKPGRSCFLDALSIPNAEVDPPTSYLNNPSILNSWTGGILAKEVLASTALSGIAHLCIILFMIVAPYYVTSGSGSQGEGAVMVRLVEQDLDVAPLDESAGSRDSPASVPMLAKRTLKRSQNTAEHLSAPEQSLLEKSKSGTKDAPSLHDATSEQVDHKLMENRDNKTARPALQDLDKTKVTETPPDATVADLEKVETPHDYDSAASLPSTASAPRMASSAAGKAGDEYRNKILSAISAAAFYPRKALIEKIHGETIVTFTVNNNGAIIHLAIKKPSGSNILDDAAVAIIKKASRHFPSFPSELSFDSLSYDVPIIFKERS